MYNVDYSPGIAVGTEPDHDYEQNRMFYTTILKEDIIIGLDENKAFTNNNVSQSFPNPAFNTTHVKVELNNAAKVHLELTNLVGQVVYSIPVKELNKGTHILNIDVSGLNSGLYIYTVYANDKKLNKKLIVE
jgi:hypothetical protein